MFHTNNFKPTFAQPCFLLLWSAYLYYLRSGMLLLENGLDDWNAYCKLYGNQ